MAAGNPSTIGTGTEVLRRKFVHANSDTGASLINGVSDHIYTILSVIVCNQDDVEIENFSLYIDPDTGTDNIYLVQSQVIGGYQTYVFSEKIVITNTDVLYGYTTTGNMDIYCSYIDQDWS